MVDYLFGLTDPGNVRTTNEDIVVAEEIMDAQYLLAGVIDGVGGYAGGEIAAAMTKDLLLREFTTVSQNALKQLQQVFFKANEEIFDAQKTDRDKTGMACVATIALIDLHKNQLFYIHVGDTRLYLYRDNALIKISHDQSFVGFLEDSGRLTEEEAMAHPKRNQINQALGFESRLGRTENYFETGTSAFLPGDLLLICSDGLTDMIDKASIMETISQELTLEMMGKSLIAKANLAGGTDNISIALAKNTKNPLQTTPPEPLVRRVETVNPVGEPIPALEKDVVPAAVVRSERPNTSIKMSIALIGIVLLLLAVTVGLYTSNNFANYGNPEKTKKTVLKQVTVKVDSTAQEQRLARQIANLKGNVLILQDSTYKSPILLTQPLLINRDTLVIKTVGEYVLKGNPTYRGPAIVLTANCKYIMINGIIFKDFMTGISADNTALETKNVRFIGVKHPIIMSFSFPEQYFINGRVSRSFKADSSLKK